MRVFFDTSAFVKRYVREAGTDAILEWCDRATEIGLSGIALAVHCGGCMLNEREIQSRVERAAAAGVPMTNYGVAIAQMHGILRRSLSPFPELLELLK